jgi:hypothetical protein
VHVAERNRRDGRHHAPLNWAGGRPIIVTDLRDPANPVGHPMEPVDLFRRDGVTAYSHDVQVDDMGIAWVSGDGGTRGYWTKGTHRDPLTGQTRTATPLDPIPYAGGGFAKSETNDDTGGFEHNAERPVGRNAASAYRNGDYLLATEEDFADPSLGCSKQGHFNIASLEGSYDGEAWLSTPKHKFRLKTVGSWAPYKQEGSRPIGGPYAPGADFCSAHYFDVAGDTVAYAWYGEGTRFLDISDEAAEADRLLAARRHARLGLLHARRLRLHGGPRARHRRASAHVRGPAGA